MVILPKGMKADDLVPDPAGRHGHWLHERTGTIVNMGPDFRPGGDGEKVETDNQDKSVVSSNSNIGKRVEVVADGPLKGMRGQISATDAGENDDLTTVIMDEKGNEETFAGVGDDLRLLSQDEIRADEAALEAKIRQVRGNQ